MCSDLAMWLFIECKKLIKVVKDKSTPQETKVFLNIGVDKDNVSKIYCKFQRGIYE